MSAQQNHNVWTAYLSDTAGLVPVGRVLCLNAAGTRYVVSTAANRVLQTLGSVGIALTAGDDDNPAVELQVCGLVPASITGLGPGAAGPVRTSTLGLLERVASPGPSDEVVGKCDVEGNALVFFGTVTDFPTVISGTLPGGAPGDTQHNVNNVDFGGSQQGLPAEFLGLVGDDSTDNAASFLAAIVRFNANTSGQFAISLASKPYKTAGMVRSLAMGTPHWPFGLSVHGQGPRSLIRITTDDRNAFIVADTDDANRAKETHFGNFRVEGTASGHYGDGTDFEQNAIQIGFFQADGASRVLVDGVSGYRLKGCFFVNSMTDSIAIGPRVSNCYAEDCFYGYFSVSAADYLNCQAVYCDVGLSVGGNTQWRGGSIQTCVTGVLARSGGNDAHGVFSGRLVHNLRPIDIQPITNGFMFDSTLLFQGDIRIANGAALVQFTSSYIDATTYTLNGKSVWWGTIIGDGYYFSNDTTGGQNEFVGVRDLTGNIPAWVGEHMQAAFSFAADANESLSAQKSVAETLIVTDGSATVARKVTSALLARKGNARRVWNNSTHAHTFAWASGAAVTLRPGHWMTIGCDGTNAILLEDAVLNDTVDTLTNKTLVSPVVTGLPVYRDGGVDIKSIVTRVATAAVTQVNCGTYTVKDQDTSALDVIVRCRRDTSNTKRGVWKFSAVVSRNGAGAVLDVLNVGDAFNLNGGTVTCDVNGNDFRVRITPADTDARHWDSEIREQDDT